MSGAIAVISPSKTLTRMMRGLLAERGLEWTVIEGAQHDAVELARGLVAGGVSVLISRGRTARILRESFALPVVEVRHTFFDCINAYRQAARLSTRIAFLATSEGYARILDQARPFMGEVTLCRVDPTGNVGSIEASLDDLVAQGIEVAIGGLSLVHAVESRGLHHIMSTTDADAAAEAVDEAVHLLRIEQERQAQRQALQERYEMIRSILDCVSEGILGVDAEGVVTRLNQVAKGYLGTLDCGDSILDRLPRQYFAQVLQRGTPVRGALVSVGRLSLTLSIMPITLEQQVIGAVATLQNQTDITAIEKKMRRQLASRHVAETRFEQIVGDSPALARARHLAQTYAQTDSTLMIEGETGTGKELFAQSIHNASTRRNGPFVAINCAAFAPGVLESELFGHVKGAFTGALAEGKAGVFELAHTGTLFLDEISETSADIQLKLLRALQERKVVRMGDDKVTPVDIRIITASNRPLPDRVADGSFREDFYYRICVLRLRLPPLRERREDIPVLVHHLSKAQGTPAFEPDDALLAWLMRYPWPGNVRQLGNIVERLNVMARIAPLQGDWLDEALDDLESAHRIPNDALPPSEHALLFEALAASSGNRQAAAQRLGISTTTLWRRMKPYLERDPACFDAARYTGS